MAYRYERMRFDRGGNNLLTPAIQFLLIANVLAFVVQHFLGIGRTVLVNFALFPIGSDYFRPWQIITYGFLHANFAHIFMNMFALWMFGSALERVWGTQRFITYYVVCVLGAALTQLAVSSGPTLGASGGVFGILLAFGVLFPRTPIMLLFIPVPIEARYFVAIYAAIELFLGVTGTTSGVAHFAHLGGMVFGFFMLQYYRGRWPFGRQF